MANIRKLLEQVEGGQVEDLYPVTSTDAVFDSTNKSLTEIINSLRTQISSSNSSSSDVTSLAERLASLEGEVHTLRVLVNELHP